MAVFFLVFLCFSTLQLTAATGEHHIVFPVSVTLEEGDACTLHSGAPGRCTDIRNCDYTNLNLRQNPPVRCGFKGIFPVVCCPYVQSGDPMPVTDISWPRLAFNCSKLFELPPLVTGKSRLKFATVGGEMAIKHEWPWMALIGEGNGKILKWFCGGALINEQWVLSAIHCLFNNKAEMVRLGEHNHQDDNDAPHQDFEVAETVAYPGYTYPEAYHDLVLYRLSSRVSVREFISPVCLPWGQESEADITGHEATLTGYGDTESGGIPTPYLQVVNMTVFPSARCDHNYSTLHNFKEIWPQGIGQETLCAGDPNGGRDACQGDSGGPLVSRSGSRLYTLRGIVSRGHGCGKKEYPGLYANLHYAPYLAWIKKVAFTVS